MSLKITIDASVVLSFVLYQKPKTVSKIKEIQSNKVRVFVTPFFKSEITNGLRYSVKDPIDAEKLLEQILELCDKFEEFQLSDPSYQQILAMAIQNSTSVYDTAYHYIALTTKSNLFTCDSDYFQKAKHLGNIEYLG